MSLLLDAGALAERRRIAAGPLRPLADSLTADLEPLLEREIHFPDRKALLSRAGGRCEDDGTLLEFDPFSPHEHVCPRCGRVHRGELHDGFWIYWYQLWLAERAVHAALFARFGDARFAPLAETILRGYADRYLHYPNVDNVLGPTRLFFSTYLESIWLLQICVAADLIDPALPALARRVRDEIVEPSRDLIAQFDEGGSNRQVWNDVALLAAARLLDDGAAAKRAVAGPSGIAWQVAHGLLSDGTWYEGENYHQFAHRGLWYGVTMAEHAGLSLDRAALHRFQRGFGAPFRTALPDFTMPSRRDSQYAISLRQWRIAEHCELGLAREDDATLRAALGRLYHDPVPRGTPHRERSAADVERNLSASSLSRADLSWRALLFALPELPPLDAVAPESALLEGQGLAVFRRERGRVYVALDYGHSGGGHGHSDRLNLLLVRDGTRWLDDFGTGSYVDRSLHWYRSTLAHNAPLANGRSQSPTHGTLVAYDETPAAGWIRAEAEIAPGVRVRRSVVVLPTYLVDVVSWTAAEGADAERSPGSSFMLDLPLHAAIELVGAGVPAPQPLTGAHGLEDGFDFARETACQPAPGSTLVTGVARAHESLARVWASSSSDCEWWRATAPGAPGHGDRPFRLVRSRARAGEHRFVWTWADDVLDVRIDDAVRVELAGGAVHEHRAAPDDSWQIDVVADTRSRIVLGGGRAEPAAAEGTRAPGATPALRVSRSGETVISLGERHYRRSEETWDEAGRPRASIGLTLVPGALRIMVSVPSSDVTFAPRNAENPYDNESADVNGDGVQLYVKRGTRVDAWMVVPELGADRVRVRPIAGDPAQRPEAPRASWHRIDGGYRLRIDVPGELPSALDVVVNEMPRGRRRRRGQLVLSGGRGEFVYLRGDRQDEDRLVPLERADD